MSSPRLYHGRSRIDGEGVFTLDAIPAGSHVLDCSGVLLTRDEVESAPDERRMMQVRPDLYHPEDTENPQLDDFLNHSCEPNLGFSRGTLSLYAVRDIAAGEELYFDYSTCMNEPGWEIDCSCGAPRCRRTVKSYCDMSDREQHSLRGRTLAYMRTSARAANG